MSEMNGFQPRALEPVPLGAPHAPTLPSGSAPGARDLPIDELEIRHLRTAEEIRQVVHLRSEIQLPASTLADPDFHTREKKETRAASSPASAGVDNSSAPSGSSRWAAAWHPARTCS
jgi:hypothetical protein